MHRIISVLALTLSMLLASSARADKLVLVAGGGTEIENVPATQAKLNQPFGVDFDKAGNMYIVELKGNRVLKVDAKGILTFLGGTGETGSSGDRGPARSATFNGMHSLAVGPDGLLFLADTWNNRIRRLDPKSGMVDAFAGVGGKKPYAGDDGPAAKAQFGGIYCVAFDFKGSKLLITDLDNRRIRAIDLKSGTVQLVAGNGKKGVPMDGADAKTAPLVDPEGKIRTVVGVSGKAGNTGDDGDARQATLNGPKHLCVDPDDNVIIADSANHVIRKYSPKDKKIVRLAGTGKKGDSGNGGDPLQVALYEPHGVTVSPAGVLFIVDSLNHRIFRWEK